MNVFITGGLGFVGRFLSQHLLTAGYHVTAVGSTQRPEMIPHENFQYIAGDTTREGAWQAAVADSDAVINLAGRSIYKRWDASYKQQIYNSRVLTTRQLVAALPDGKETVFLNASAVGYYGDRGDDILTESEPGCHDFLGTLARDWESEALKAESKRARVAIMRLGVVLGNGGGALKMMRPIFSMFAGGPLGNGMQWFPWIHMTDLTRAIRFLLENNNCRGPFNLCNPEPVRNRDLTTALARVLSRPAFMPAPEFMIKWVMGEFGGVLLSSSRAIPENLLKAGFTFRFPDIESALVDLVKR